MRSRRAGILPLAALLALLAAAAAPTALAGELTVNVGPPSLGSGGSNPVSIPPVSPVEYQLELVSQSGYEGSLAFSPGIFFGKRSWSKGDSGVYVGLGGGYVIDINGAGPGTYASLGYESSGKSFRFNAELKQAAGYDFQRKNVLTPYSIKLGMSFVFGRGGSSE